LGGQVSVFVQAHSVGVKTEIGFQVVLVDGGDILLPRQTTVELWPRRLYLLL
jgi:hypothetical protein